MTLYHLSISGLYGHRAPVKDKERPNFLFSTDIPYRISTCIAELHLYLCGYSRNVVDLSRHITSFNVTLELNALLLRNKGLLPLELVQNNHLFVARSRAPDFNIGMVRSISRFLEVWKSILSMQEANERFVVNFRLHLDQFSVDLAHASDISLQFHADEAFSSLLLADLAMTGHLKTYICQKLLQELNSDLSVHVTDSSTILHDLLPNESFAQFQSLYGSSQRAALDFANVSLDESDSSCVIEKQLVFYEEDDFDNSGNEMRILHSDESGKCNSNEDEESDVASPASLDSRQLTQQELSDFLGKVYNTSVSTTSRPTSVSTAIMDYEHRHQIVSPFPASRNHNKSLMVSILEDTANYEELEIQSLGQNRSSSPAQDFSPGTKTGLAEDSKSSFEELGKEISDFASECDDTISSPMSSPQKREVHNYTPGSQDDVPLLRKKTSLSFIDHDDGLGLDFAFRSATSSVPEYIKENKKFKFIKVGKVQKFVNMFEEHRKPPRNTPNYTSTRPGSPIRKAD